MEITLNSALAATLPYAPYIAAGIATIAALAAIYFYMQSRKETTPPPIPNPDPVPDPKPAPVFTSEQVVDAFLNEFLTQDLPQAIEKAVIARFNVATSEITDKTSPTAVRPILNRALEAALEHVSTCEGLGNLASAFIDQTYSVLGTTMKCECGRLLNHRPTQDYLASQFKEIWKHPAARAETLLPFIPGTENKAFKAAGIEVLRPKFEATENLDEKRRLAQDLETLEVKGNWTEACFPLEIRLIREEFWGDTTSLARKEEIVSRLQVLSQDTSREKVEFAMLKRDYAFEPTDVVAQEALALHQTLTTLADNPLITTPLIATCVPEGLFSEEALLAIKQTETNIERNQALHTYTTTLHGRYKEHFEFPALKQAFIDLTIKIDRQTENDTLIEECGMDPTIKAACWLDLMSYDAMETYRDLQLDMDQSGTDAAIARAATQY